MQARVRPAPQVTPQRRGIAPSAGGFGACFGLERRGMASNDGGHPARRGTVPAP